MGPTLVSIRGCSEWTPGHSWTPCSSFVEADIDCFGEAAEADIDCLLKLTFNVLPVHLRYFNWQLQSKHVSFQQHILLCIQEGKEEHKSFVLLLPLLGSIRECSMDSPWYPSENARWTPVAPFPRPVFEIYTFRNHVLLKLTLVFLLVRLR